MKKIVFCFASVLACLFALTLFGSAAGEEPQTGKAGKNIVWSFDADTGTLCFEGEGEMYDQVLSSRYDVRVEGEIKHIVIGDGITYVGNEAFRACDELTDVSFGKDVKTIGINAFCGCPSLREIRLPSSVSRIMEGAFGWCGLTKATILKGVLYEPNVFEKASIQQLTVEDGVINIPAGICRDCKNLSYLCIPDSVSFIREEAFAGCKSLRSVFLGKGVTTVEEYAFRECDSMETLVILSKKADIDMDAFEGCLRRIKNIVDFSRSLNYGDAFDAEILAGRTKLFIYKDIHDFPLIKKCGVEYTALKDYELSDGDHLFTDFYYEITKEPTCTEKGEGRRLCLTCGKAGDSLPLDTLPHAPKESLIPATTEKDGAHLTACLTCGTELQKTVIPKIETFSMTRSSETDWYFKVKATDANGKVIYPSVTYENIGNVGVAAVTVEFRGDYAGTFRQEYIIKPGELDILKGKVTGDSVSMKLWSAMGLKGCTIRVFISEDEETWTEYSYSEATSIEFDHLKPATHYYLKAYIESPYGNGPEKKTVFHTDLSTLEPYSVIMCCARSTETRYKCRSCNYVQTDFSSPVREKHLPDEEHPIEYVPPKCNAKGYKVMLCTVCGNTVRKTLDALPHTYGEWVRTSEPTYSKYGREERVCSVCGDIDTRLIDMIPHTHIIVEDEGYAPTCTKAGMSKSSHCSLCGQYFELNYISPLGHSYIKVLTKATTKKSGSQVTKCSVCGHKMASRKIARIASFTLSSTSCTYTGKAKKPKVTVTDTDGKVIEGKYYTVSYADNTAVGTAKVKLTFKGDYAGTKTLKFKILPAQVKGLKALSIKKTSVKLSWTKAKGAKYYRVEKSTDGKKWTTVTTTSETAATVSSLKSGKKVCFRVTALNETKKTAAKPSAVLKVRTK